MRAGRAKPGLAAQHASAIHAAAAVGAAEVEGAEIGSQAFRFVPRALQGGAYHFDIGTAGSTILVLQTVLPALLHADRPSRVAIRGGTHNTMAPPFEFLAETYLPALAGTGARVSLDLERHGFYPRGGGLIVAEVEPLPAPRPLALAEPVTPRAVDARALVVRLPRSIADRELAVCGGELGLPGDCLHAVEVEDGGPGNAVLVRLASGPLVELASAIGQRGLPAEQVAAAAVADARRYLAAGAPVGEHLADQLLVPLALAAGGRYLTGPPSSHTRTNAETVHCFLPGTVELGVPDAGGHVTVAVTGRVA